MMTRVGIFALAVLLGLGAVEGQAQAPTATAAGIAYATGGVGADEMQKLRAREKEFNLKLVFTLVEGNYLSDVSVVVKDKAGRSLLSATGAGPLFLAKLPRGSYVVDATYEGKTQSRTLTVSDRLRTEYLRWPSNPNADFPGPRG
ncbi:MAG: carboxypeptidase regulatory-like domain-containing protein [Burkholderiales bacterium]